MPATATRMHLVLDAVRRAHGVIRTTELEALGLSRHWVRRAVETGQLQRVRRGWVALPGADAYLVSAATHGVLLTCVTQAQRLGLWVHDSQAAQVHVAVAPGAAGGRPNHIRVHWKRPLLPRKPGQLEDSIENVLALVADCEPHERALAIWDSALQQQKVSRERLARLPLQARARALLVECWPFADSGLETYMRTRLKWMRIPLHFQTWIAGHRVDLLIGDRLVVQVDGSTHTGAQRDEDIRHDMELRLLGYTVMRVGYRQVMDRWHEVQTPIMDAVAQGLHLM